MTRLQMDNQLAVPGYGGRYLGLVDPSSLVVPAAACVSVGLLGDLSSGGTDILRWHQASLNGWQHRVAGIVRLAEYPA